MGTHSQISALGDQGEGRRWSLLANGQVNRTPHLLLWVSGSDLLLNHADSKHGEEEASAEILAQGMNQ
jgi:hypothetical protein